MEAVSSMALIPCEVPGFHFKGVDLGWSTSECLDAQVPSKGNGSSGSEISTGDIHKDSILLMCSLSGVADNTRVVN